MAGQAGIVTPEAVRLEFRTADLGSRALARLVDTLIQLATLLLLGFGTALAADGIGATLPEWAGISLGLLVGFGVLWGYPVALETLWRGRTPGKAALGLRVVTREGAPVRFRHAAIRAIFGVVDIYASLGGVAVVSALLSRRQQRLGDLVAGTIVLRERTAGGTVAPVRFDVPPGAEGYASTVDVSGLAADDYATVRSFLLRASELRADARARLGTDLATGIAARLAHVPPPGVSPELFLGAVAAGYQRRSAARPPANPSGNPSGGAFEPPSGDAPGSPPPPEPVPPEPVPPPPADRGADAPRPGFTPPA